MTDKQMNNNMRSRSPADITERREPLQSRLSPGEVIDRLSELDHLVAQILALSSALGLPEVDDAAKSVSMAVERAAEQAYRISRNATFAPPAPSSYVRPPRAPDVPIEEIRSVIDARVALNVIAQKLGVTAPSYSSSFEGPAHKPKFRGSVVFCGRTNATSNHTSQKAAFERAAQLWLWDEYGDQARALTFMGSFNPYGNGQRVQFTDTPVLCSVFDGTHWIVTATLVLASIGANPPSFAATTSARRRDEAESQALQILTSALQAEEAALSAERLSMMGSFNPYGNEQLSSLVSFSSGTPGHVELAVPVPPGAKSFTVRVVAVENNGAGVVDFYVVYRGAAGGAFAAGPVTQFPGDVVDLCSAFDYPTASVTAALGPMYTKSSINGASVITIKRWTFGTPSSFRFVVAFDTATPVDIANVNTTAFIANLPINIKAVNSTNVPSSLLPIDVVSTFSTPLANRNLPIDITAVGSLGISQTVPVTLTAVGSTTAASGVINVNLSRVQDVALTKPQVGVDIVAVDGTDLTQPQVPVDTSGSAPADVNLVGVANTLDNPIWVSDTKTSSIFDGFDAAQARGHNRRMHTLNGNTTWSEASDRAADALEQAIRAKAQLGHDDPGLASLPINSRPVTLCAHFIYTGEWTTESIIRWVASDFGDAEAWTQIAKKKAETAKRQVRQNQTQQADKSTGPQVKTAAEPAEKRATLDTVVFRVRSKLQKSSQIDIARYFSQAEHRWALIMATSLWGSEWKPTDSWLHWFVAYRCMRPSTETAGAAFVGLQQFDDEFKQFIDSESGRQSVSKRFGAPVEFFTSDDATTVNIAAELAAMRLALMGSFNPYGNGQPWPKVMADVRATPDIDAAYSAPLLTRFHRPWVTASEQASVTSSTLPAQASLADEMPIRGDRILPDVTVERDFALPFPATMLQPRQTRSAGGATIHASVNSVQYTTYATVNSNAAPLDDTALQNLIVEAAIRANQNLGRADNTTLGGFNAIDVATIARILCPTGLSMQQALFKLLTIYYIKAWEAQSASLPRNNATQIDPRAAWDFLNRPAIAMNDLPNNGENCGGPAALLPFHGGLTGSVGLHLCLRTVPAGINPILIPANVLNNAPNPDVVLFLFMVMFGPCPLGLWSLRQMTLDEFGGNPLLTWYIHNVSTAVVAGEVDLHFLLPRNTTARNPTTPNDAMSLAVVAFNSGTTASAGIPANVPLQINYVGGALVTHNMAQLAYTYQDDFGMEDIRAVLQRMNDVVDITEELKYCAEFLSATCGMLFPPLCYQDRDAEAKFDVDAVIHVTNALGYEPEEAVGNFPQPPPSKMRYVLDATLPMAWNKVVLQVAIASGLSARGGALPTIISGVNSLWWFELLSMPYAITTCVHRSLLGFTGETWASTYTNSNLELVRSILMSHYCRPVGMSFSITPSVWSSKLDALYTHLFDYSPRRSSNVSAFSRICPPGTSVLQGYGVPRRPDNTGCLFLIPVFLADAWINFYTRRGIRGLCALPPPGGSDSVVGLGSDYAVAMVNAGLWGPALAPHTVRNAITQNSTRDDTDEEIWNSRLVHILVGPVAYTLGGNVIVGFQANSFPKQQVTADDDATSAAAHGRMVGILTANTMSIPLITNAGMCVFLADAQPAMIPITRIMAGRSRGYAAAWALNGLVPYSDAALSTATRYVGRWARMLAPASDSSTSPMTSGGVSTPAAAAPAGVEPK